MTKFLGSFLLLAVLISLSFSAKDARADRKQQIAAELSRIQQMKSVMYQVNEQDLSCQNVTDCQAIAMGSRACGGPTAFVVVSLNNKALPNVKTMIDDVTKAEADFNRDFGMMSICSIEMPPPLGCVSNKCIEWTPELERR